MRKAKLLFMGAIALSTGSVMAQGTATVFGIVDLAAIYGHGSINHLLTEGAGNMSSRIGFRGTEDLGSGLSAGFWLEAGLNADDGSGIASNTNNTPSGATTGNGLVFNRRGTVSLVSKSLGEIRLGRDYSAQYRNRVEVDPWNSIGIATIQPFQASPGGSVSTRASNLVTYFLPEDLYGFYGMLQDYQGEGPAGGTGRAGRLGYKWGGLNVSLSDARTTYPQTATTGPILSESAAVHYTIAGLVMHAGYFKDTISVSGGRTLPYKGWSLAGVYNIGVAFLKAGVSEYGQAYGAEQKGLKYSVGAEYYLSKRTLLYVDAATLEDAVVRTNF